MHPFFFFHSHNAPPQPPQQQSCDFCPYGGRLVNVTQPLVSDPTSTCGDWAALAQYAKDGENSCAVFQYVGLECCDDMVLPEFFSDYYEEEGDEDEEDTTDEVVTEQAVEAEEVDFEETTDTAAAEVERPDDSAAESTEPEEDTTTSETNNDGTSTIDPNDIEIPFAESEPVEEPTLSSKVHICFEQHTELPSAINSQQQEQPEVLPNSEGAQPSVEQQTLGSQPFSTRQASDAFTVGSTSVSMDKFAKLMEDLHQVAILPDNFHQMVPNEEFANHTFLPALSTCLGSAVQSFQTCPLCENGDAPTKPQKMIPIVGLYCHEYDAWKADAKGEDCSSISAWLPFDMASYCGCPGVPDPPVVVSTETTTDIWELPNTQQAVQEECTFCPEGMVLILESWKHGVSDPSVMQGYEEDSTCTHWSEMTDYATTTKGCSLLHQIGSAGCCEPIGDSILDSMPVSTEAPRWPVIEISSATSITTTTCMVLGLASLLLV